MSVLVTANMPAELREAFGALSRPDLALFEALLVLRRHGFEPESAAVARQLLEHDPKNLVVALHAARALEAAGERDRARDVLANAVTTSPKSPIFRLELGMLLQRGPSTKEAALATFEEGVALVPEDGDLQLARGMALNELGRIAEAEVAYRSTLRVLPKSLVARNNLAWLLAQRGGKDALDEALALAQSVVRDAPDMPAAFDTLARIELARGEPKAAVESAQKAATMAPLDATLRLTFAKSLDALERKQDAANQYEVALLLSASFDGRADAAKRLAQLRDSKKGD
jgi:Flp pilus assembly protein TadD